MNFIVLCIWLILVMNVMNSGFDPVQMTKMSSMNRFHNFMCGLPTSFNFSSNFPIKRFAYAGAILVPIAVPWICKKYLLLNSNTLFFNTMSISSVNTSGMGCSGRV